jgi:hypothetical protein
MQVGPITLMRTKTFSELLSKQEVLWEENSRLAIELGGSGTKHSFMHYPWNATTAKKLILQSDDIDEKHLEAVSRVIKAYQKAIKEQVKAAPGMWQDLEEKNTQFVNGLSAGNIPEVSRMLSGLFQSQFIWGLGKFDQVLLNDMKEPHEKSHLQLRITDALVSLAKALGVRRLTSVEQQGIEPHIRALDVNLESLVEDIETELGFVLDSPRLGGSYGCNINDKFITLDGVINTYIAHRLRQLGANQDSRIVEIGGGFGCLAEIARRALHGKYVIYDLPWVVAIQGYFLIMSLPPGTVRLFGEQDGPLEILPFWHFNYNESRSLDFIVNSDSLPEMGYDTAVSYIQKISQSLRGSFLSINQEAMAKNTNAGQQNCVNSIVKAVGGLKLVSRSVYWMRQGYAEELFVPG